MLKAMQRKAAMRAARPLDKVQQELNQVCEAIGQREAQMWLLEREARALKQRAGELSQEAALAREKFEREVKRAEAQR